MQEFCRCLFMFLPSMTVPHAGHGSFWFDLYECDKGPVCVEEPGSNALSPTSASTVVWEPRPKEEIRLIRSLTPCCAVLIPCACSYPSKEPSLAEGFVQPATLWGSDSPLSWLLVISAVRGTARTSKVRKCLRLLAFPLFKCGYISMTEA